ncbi:hypothetical protein OIO11_06570, partial [Clostridium sp. ZS2-4]|nr:hypothetical protein [Clostridium sp. ZS2-4]
SKRYNCTILDLYDRSVIATLNSKEITSDLAIKTLKLALKNHKLANTGLILHSYLFYFKNDDLLNRAVYDYANSWYNHLRPHSFNKGLTPFEARYSS